MWSPSQVTASEYSPTSGTTYSTVYAPLPISVMQTTGLTVDGPNAELITVTLSVPSPDTFTFSISFQTRPVPLAGPWIENFAIFIATMFSSPSPRAENCAASMDLEKSTLKGLFGMGSPPHSTSMVCGPGS